MTQRAKISLSKFARELAPFYVMEALERAKQIENSGADVIHLEVGEPDFPAPQAARRAAVEAIKKGRTGYAPSLGTEEIREAIARVRSSKYRIKTSADNVLVTSGSSPALLLSVLCLANPGDEVVITDPHYACCPAIIRATGATAVTVPVYAEENYQMEIGRLKKRISSKTKAIIINSPANPTGAVQSDDTLKSICSLGIPVISDEIYHGLEYGGKSKSILNHTDAAVAVNGFSKIFSMTGWRLGYMTASPKVIRAAQKIQQNLFISANPFVQSGAAAALPAALPHADGMAQIYKKRKRAMIRSLEKIGLAPCGNPEGAFYIFVKMPENRADSRALAFDILEKTNVAVAPGIDFGAEGEGHLRLSYATSVEKIKEGVRRIGEYAEKFF